MTPRASTSEREQTNYSASIFLGLRTEHTLKPINLTSYYHQIIRFIRGFVQSVAPRIRTEIILFTCRFACSRGHSCMRMAVEKPNPPIFTYLLLHFQGIFNSSVSSEPIEHTESNMTILRVDRFPSKFKIIFVNFAYGR